MNIDPKSIKILKSMYWKNGWIETSDRRLSESDKRYLSSQGWSLGVIEISHDKLIKKVKEISRDINIQECTSMLSQSLASRRVQDRSFLSSAIQAIAIPEHKHTASGSCSICGLSKNLRIDQDVLLFEKIMWGGVRLTDLEYVWLDLKLMKGPESHNLNCEDLLRLIRNISNATEELSASKFAASLKEIKGNKAEREVLCGILGVCDILQHPDHPGYLESYRTVSERELPDQHYIDLEWPYCWYNSKFGVNSSAVDAVTQKQG